MCLGGEDHQGRQGEIGKRQEDIPQWIRLSPFPAPAEPFLPCKRFLFKASPLKESLFWRESSGQKTTGPAEAHPPQSS